MMRKRAYRSTAAVNTVILLLVTAAPAIVHVCNHAGESAHGRLCERAPHDMGDMPMSKHCDHAGDLFADLSAVAGATGDKCCVYSTGAEDLDPYDPAVEIPVSKLLAHQHEIRQAHHPPAAPARKGETPERAAATPTYRLNSVILC